MDSDTRSELDRTVRRLAEYTREATRSGDRAEKVQAVAELTTALASLVGQLIALDALSATDPEATS